MASRASSRLSPSGWWKKPADQLDAGQSARVWLFSNVNPEVDHPRWSQASERRIGEFLKRKTLMFNGYAEQVAGLYRGMDLRKFFDGGA